MRKQNMVLMAACVLVTAVAFAAVVWWQMAVQPGPTVSVADIPADPEPATRPLEAAPLDVEQVLQKKLSDARSEEEHLQALDAFAADPAARSSAPILRSTMLTGQTAGVRVKAFSVAKELAKHESREALIAVLRDGVGNPYQEVRRESIRACRDNPSYELVGELMAIVRQGGTDRSVAIQALAFTDDPEAQKLVLDTAKSEEVPRADRIQAIALLSRTDLEEGVSYLKELATGEDPALQAYAMEALTIRQARKKAEGR